MKITKGQLRQIISKSGALTEARLPAFGLFRVDFMYDLLVEEVENYLQSSPSGTLGGLTKTEAEMLRKVVNSAVDDIIKDYGQ